MQFHRRARLPPGVQQAEILRAEEAIIGSDGGKQRRGMRGTCVPWVGP
jgi:hypothetical protein